MLDFIDKEGSKAGKARKRHDKRLPTVSGGLAHTTRHATSIIPKLHFRVWTEDDDADWWFAGTAVPLLAATLGPAANVLSIAAMVTSWRVCLVPDVEAKTCTYNGNSSALVPDIYGTPYHDPDWAYHPNIASLVVGFVGNLFLLFNFTGFVRYKISLPVTIFSWYIASAILIGITTSMHVYQPPIGPQQTYSQGFWYGVLAAVLYMIAAMMLMLNMLGFFLGHFPEHFNLTDSQRTLINQTMMFFIWLAGGGEVFSALEIKYGDRPQDWGYVNGLYFCDVTILTVGFGDLAPTSTVGRAFVFPYAVIGITMLGLVITSIVKFAKEIGSDKIIMKHQERSRARTFERSEQAAEQLLMQKPRSRRSSSVAGQSISSPFDPVNTSEASRVRKQSVDDDIDPNNLSKSNSFIKFATNTGKVLTPGPLRRSKSHHNKHDKKHHEKKHHNRAKLLKEERDRFNTMRRLQRNTLRYKRWMGLTLSLFCFSMLWLLGALVFFYAEPNWSYFDALYFCYVSLLTIGYGDYAPDTNIGRPFFVVWSLIAVPTMTILFSAFRSTIVTGFKDAVNKVAEVTYMPRMGLFKEIRIHAPIYNYIYKPIRDHIRKEREARELDRRLRAGFPVGVDEENGPAEKERRLSKPTPEEEDKNALDLEHLARRALDGKHPQAELALARRLAAAIKQVSADQRAHPPRTYGYEEWLEFTQLIRFTNYTNGREPAHRHHHSGGADDLDAAVEESKELIEWDWIGANSPMMANETEAEFVLDRLCESMGRYLRHLSARVDADVAMKKARQADAVEEVKEEDERGSNSGGSTAVDDTAARDEPPTPVREI